MRHHMYTMRRALRALLVAGLILASATPLHAQGDEGPNRDTVDETNPYDLDPADLPPEWGPVGLVGIPHPDDATESTHPGDTLPEAFGARLWLPSAAGSAVPTDGARSEAVAVGGGGARARGDFNNDGYDDLVIGVPDEDVRDLERAGLVHVLYGGENGLHSIFRTFPSSAAETKWGFALAVGDFDGDGYDDLAASTPLDDVNAATQSGSLSIVYGGANGLNLSRNQKVHQDVSGALDQADNFDTFGFALAAGDFNGNGYDDLAVSVLTEDITLPAGGTAADAGAVQVFYGSASGITMAGNQFWHQDSADIANSAEAGDWFGYALASGDFDGNGSDDLAISVYAETIGSAAEAGAVHVLFGTASGLSATNSQFWHQDVAGIADIIEAFDGFGDALASGNFDGNAYDDLAISVSFENVGLLEDAGVVHVLYGTSNRLSAANSQLWSQNTPSILENSQAFDSFGWSLAVGNFNGDAYDELAVGTVYESVGTVEEAGMVQVIYGSATRLTAAGNQAWHQNKVGVLEQAETGDLFGWSLGVGDFDGNGADDLSVGVIGEDVVVAGVTYADAGIVQVFSALPGVGLLLIGDQVFNQNDLVDTVEAGDNFGLVQ